MQDRGNPLSSSAAAPVTTVNDQLALQSAWLLGDPVLGVRVWGTTYERPFPPKWDGSALPIGRHPESWCFLAQPPELSRLHATIERHATDVWMFQQQGATPIRCDGLDHAAIKLIPGLVTSLAGVPLVASSERTRALRLGIKRYLGYSALAEEHVERVLYGALRRHHLVIEAPPGGGGVALAQYLHRASGGTAWPFLHWTQPVTDRPDELLRRARTGMLVVRIDNLGDDPSRLLGQLDHHKVRLVLLAPSTKPGKRPKALPPAIEQMLAYQLTRVRVPELRERPQDLPQILNETIAYYMERVGADRPLLSAADYQALGKLRPSLSHDDLDNVLETLVYVRQWGVGVAAVQLARNRQGMYKLLSRYKLQPDNQKVA